MKVSDIIKDFKKQQAKPIYWLEGEEPFFIDEIVKYAEKNILTEAEADFNQTIFYGRDSDIVTILSTCKKFPMFAEKQVVIIKEAQNLKKIEDLLNYFENPSETTILIVAHMEKNIDGRSKFGKYVKDKTIYFQSNKLKPEQVSDWIETIIGSKKISIEAKANQLLVDHIGNDLSRIANEIDKIIINKSEFDSVINIDDIEKFVGISKEYNAFELQQAIIEKNKSKAYTIINYFEKNPKAGPLIMVISLLYSLFSKAYGLSQFGNMGEQQIANAMGLKSSWFIKDPIRLYKNYGLQKVELSILILEKYNLKAIGIDSAGYDDGLLMQEMVAKIINL